MNSLSAGTKSHLLFEMFTTNSIGTEVIHVYYANDQSACNINITSDTQASQPLAVIKITNNIHIISAPEINCQFDTNNAWAMNQVTTRQ